MPPTSPSPWAWAGWGALEALGTLAAALVALSVYLSEVRRRRRAERSTVRVWASKEADETVIYIANDSAVPIVDITLDAFYQEDFWSSWLSGGVRWSAIGWLARGPAIVHPSQTLALKLNYLRLYGVKEAIKRLPELTLLQMRYEARAEPRRVASFRRVKNPPTKIRIVGFGELEQCVGQYPKSG
ncbi:hypothetical protein [Micromonospora parathelypteridis]|uniref:Uncharacterized protein n=1 Tax=Micromonospora parathelypteridis TaxID=1839617 RepID=A0A840VH88_9ACTN|nr:hypothetical protein [Micromonospora parathelypteridis]MBB5476202.1 hypothetical protein [Micromonospora parathelypteridis]GGO13939.1 hypothetical protein GCM10011576_24420 [Micromonospora parathelypteridis]